jgi:hypothetical protein
VLEESGRVEDAPAAVLAAWSVVHGIATLALTGNLQASALFGTADATDDLLAITRRSAALLFPASERDEDR